MRLTPIPALSDNYIWLFADDAGHALVVDPGEAEPVERELRAQDLVLTTILLTHHHQDHIGGTAALVAAHAPRVIGPEDPRIPDVDRRVREGDHVDLDAPRAHFEVIEIPGHTRSHIAFHGEGLVFCGDTLFSLGCGRLFEGSPAQMLASLDRLGSLADDTLVCCAHEYTLANAKFAATVEPDNADLQRRRDEVERLRADDRPSVPSRLGDERLANPFLRVDQPAVIDWCRHAGVADGREARFAALRQAKDGFRA